MGGWEELGMGSEIARVRDSKINEANDNLSELSKGRKALFWDLPVAISILTSSNVSHCYCHFLMDFEASVLELEWYFNEM